MHCHIIFLLAALLPRDKYITQSSLIIIASDFLTGISEGYERKKAKGALSNKSLLLIMNMISKYSSMYFAEKPDEMQPQMRKRLEDYMLLRFRQIFALPGGAKYPCEDLGKLLREEKKREPDRLAKIVEAIIKELKTYLDAEEREKERRRKGEKPLIEEYVT